MRLVNVLKPAKLALLDKAVVGSCVNPSYYLNLAMCNTQIPPGRLPQTT